MPLSNNVLKQMVSRSMVIAALSYFLLDGMVIPGMMSHLTVGVVGAGGSVISEGYLEQPGMMFGPNA